MKMHERLKDAVFQLNLLLWMCKEQPDEHYIINPLFFRWGFSILYIEQPFAFPVRTLDQIKASSLKIGLEPEPELLLGCGDGRALYFEAKARSFGVQSSNCKQARAHLIAVGSAFQEVYKYTKPFLCYVVPASDTSEMNTSLASLKDELVSQGFSIGPFSSNGIAFQDDKIHYSWDKSFGAFIGEDTSSKIIASNVSDDTDPCPLLLVFSDEDCPNTHTVNYYRQAFLEQVRAQLVCELNKLPIQIQYLIDSDDLLKKMTDGVFDFVGGHRQKKMRKMVRERIFSRIANYWSDKQENIKMSSGTLSVEWKTAAERNAFLEWLESSRTEFDYGITSADEQLLLDELMTGEGEAES